jgi:hypothetical protein
MKQARDDFFEGIGGFRDGKQSQNYNKQQQKQRVAALTEAECWNRIDQRLRKIVERACSNSNTPAGTVTFHFESFILNAYTIISTSKSKTKHGTNTTIKKHIPLNEDWWKCILLELPTITDRTDGKVSVQFFFPNDDNGSSSYNGTSGFHRLLLHAITQFHSLQTTTRTVTYTPTESNGNNTIAITNTGTKSIKKHSYEIRSMIVTGEPFVDDKYTFRLLQIQSEANKTNTSGLLSPLMDVDETVRSFQNPNQNNHSLMQDDWVHVKL